MRRDHIIFVIAMAILAAGLADGLHRGFGLPLLAAVPITATLWGVLSYRMYLQSRKEQPEAQREIEA